ncbi:SusC/RagA family TonB-linked outer membrane protein [Foetidibacter luteolus]|uniref:SusC/RagA family TonB-linked outer membrane protein n=1 Tax=Foetidibacter luteolus TaxID=2608880 RepID=UPI00129AB9B7|nr:TonB-dependent receptor [Foetidibacter luteolus]
MKSRLFFSLFCLASIGLAAQDRTVSGKVTSQEGGGALSGVSIALKGSAKGTVSDASGNFQLKVSSSSDTLVFEFVGFQKQEIGVGNRSLFEISLAPAFNSMTEVVVTGYGQQNRKTLTSAITSVKAAEISNIPASSSDQLLQGRAAGVQVNTNSGTPGGGVFVRIRGTSSINASSDPLYVIDGVPVQSNNLSGLSIGGGITNPMADINPADIESMEILKDASATAIYGARAANGVVLITTKRGASGKAKIALGFYYGNQKAPKKPGVTDGPTFERLMNEAAVNDGKPAPYGNPDTAITTNWADLIFRTGALRNVDLSISGGNEKVKYMVSGNNMLQEGILKKSDFVRSTGRVNLDFTPIEKLKIGTSLLYSYNKRGRLRNDDNISGGLEGTFFYPTDRGVYNADGSYFKIPTFENPVAAIAESDLAMMTNRFVGSIYAEYEFIHGLKLKSSYSLDYSNVEETVYDNSKTNGGSAVNGRAQALSTNNNNWIQENVLSYNFKFGKSSVSALVGTTVQKSTTSVISVTGTQFPSDDFKEVTAAAIQTATTTGTSWGIGSVFSRVNYDYDRKYLLTVNVRRDGSSRFGKANQYGTFPSVGLGWVLTEEKFLQDIPALNTLKIRGSYGITGNQSGIKDFQALGLWGGAAYADLPGISPTQLANPNLKWETTKQTDIGIDISLFQNRLNITADYYYKKTQDLLLDVSLPRSTGFNVLTQNYGELENKGFEFGISGDIVRSKSGLTWSTSLNMSFNRNKILKLAAPFNVYNRDIYRYQEGGQMFSFYLNPQTGVDPKTGAIQFEDVNGDGQFDVNNDRRIVGTANPNFTGGFTNNLSFKGFDLMFFFQFSQGNKQLHWNRFFQEHGGTRSTNFSLSQLDRWQNDGDITMIPKMTAANYASDLRPSRFLEDGSYMRLKNISLGYTLPSSLARSIKMSSARIYVSAQNIWTITNYTGLDPELTGTASNALTQGIEFYTMPQPKTIMAGINVTF